MSDINIVANEENYFTNITVDPNGDNLNTCDVNVIVEENNQFENVNVDSTEYNLNIIAQHGMGPIRWIDFVSHWDVPPTEIFNGIWSYVWLGIQRYRFVPDPYIAAQDAFYADINLSQFLVARGQ